MLGSSKRIMHGKSAAHLHLIWIMYLYALLPHSAAYITIGKLSNTNFKLIS